MFAEQATEQFLTSVDDLAQVQENLLQTEILVPNRHCDYGRQYGFAGIGDFNAFRREVPLVDYEDLRPWVERMAAGEAAVLTSQRPLAFFKTSGTSTHPKLIPVTRGLASQKIRAFAIFWELLYRAHPALRTGRMIANFGDHIKAEQTVTGEQILSETSFWNQRMHALASQSHSPLPADLRKVADPDLRYFAAARFALAGPLHAIMCLNPSTVFTLCHTIERHGEALIDGLHRGRLGYPGPIAEQDRVALAGDLGANPERAIILARHLMERQTPRLQALWPELELLVCWQSAAVLPFLQLIKASTVGLARRDYITQSSECIMSIPLEDDVSGGCLAYTSHVFEFIADDQIDQDDPATLLAHELLEGHIYELVATTAGGFYRYRTGDRMMVRLHQGRVPMLEFVGRRGICSSMTGEKVTEDQVREAALRATAAVGIGPEMFVFYPRSAGLPHYGVLAAMGPNQAIDAWIDAFEQGLCAVNVEYRDKRASGRLGAPQALLVDLAGFEQLRHRLAARRQVNEAQIKLGMLSAVMDLDREIPVRESNATD
jgi:hypothetical protein